MLLFQEESGKGHPPNLASTLLVKATEPPRAFGGAEGSIYNSTFVRDLNLSVYASLTQALSRLRGKAEGGGNSQPVRTRRWVVMPSG